jgi:two-component system, NarL family, sensor histidine kinase DegS
MPPYTRERMESGDRQARFDELHAEAKAALAYSANTLRAIRDRYREAYVDELGVWQGLRDEAHALERRPDRSAVPAAAGEGAAVAAEQGADDARLKALRGDLDETGKELGQHQSDMSRLELALRNLESTWLFLERGDRSLVTDDSATDGTAPMPTQFQMRIVEAQEAERARLAQEVHDGPAQALSNAIFQVEYIERVLESDPRLASTELRFLRELLRRELGDVRSFISQLRPPLLMQLGLDGSILDVVETIGALAGIPMTTDLQASGDRLGDAEQTVVLRIVQEALQNVRKHATATTVAVNTAIDGDDWVLEVRDDGRGFDVGAVAARGRRNFGLQFMRERAELIGARFEVRSRPDGGTVVRLAIPVHRKETG